MKNRPWFTFLAAVGLASLAFGCGGGDDDDGGGATGGSGATTGGTGGTASGGNGGATPSGTGGTTPGGVASVAGACVVSSMCLTFECIGTYCDVMVDAGPQGCELAGGAWTAEVACSTVDSVGSCRVPDPDGDTITTYYSDLGLTATDVQDTCATEGGTYTNP